MNKEEYYELKSIYEKEGQALAWNISNILRGRNVGDICMITASAYVLYRACEETINVDSIESFCETAAIAEDRVEFLYNYLGEVWQMVAGQRYRYNPNVLKSVILFYDNKDRSDNCYKTPDSLLSLSSRLLSIKDDDKVADFGSGVGSFIIESYLDNPKPSYTGIDHNADVLGVASIRFEILGCNFYSEHTNVFELDPTVNKYDKIFSNYPIGLRIKDMGYERYRLMQGILSKTNAFSKGSSSDWFFNAAIMECLKDNGKAVVIISNGSTWNIADRAARKYFIENGYIEAVISLPERMFELFNIPTTMVVLSHNNDKVMLVDATNICEKGRRYNTFTQSQIGKIHFSADNPTEQSRYVNIEEFAENDYVINPTRYLTEKIVVENGNAFDTIIKSISRGAPLKASDLDALVSEEPTDYQYLTLSNIQKGQIDDNLPYIKGIEDSQKKYCIKNHALILSKNGAPYKVAVAEVPDGKYILASGNLYVIDIDETKANPYYVKIFLESGKGIALLKSIAVGATIPNIGVEALKKISIPIIPLEEQEVIVEKYMAKISEIRVLQNRLEQAYEDLSRLYDDEA